MILLLTACGGGSEESATAPVAEQSQSLKTDEKAHILAVKPTNTWVKCADEGGLCAFTGKKAVRYGKGTQWSEVLIFDAGPLGGTPCTVDQSFYGDPVPNVLKECQVSDVTGNNLAERAVQGEWSGLQSWNVVPVHMSLLPSGRVLAHNATNDDLWPQYAPITSVWDPLTNSLAGIDPRDATLKSELFCVGFTHLPDGSLLTTGNQPNVGANYDRNVNRFNFFTQTWSREADTAFYRYYPSVATMPNGDLMTFAGTSVSAPAELMRFDGSWKTLSGMTLAQNFTYYAWGQAAPNGKLFYAGPDKSMRFIDPVGNGAMKELGNRDGLTRDYGSYALYDIGKMLVTGGSMPATETAVTINLNGAAPVVQPTGSMATPRRHNNLTILADGSLLTTGGYTGSNFTDVSNATSVLYPERWTPSTGRWTTMASAQRVRGYHSTAMLLPDGRVVVGGNGMPYATHFNQQNAEIFSPPYLFTNSGKYANVSGVTSGIGCNNATFGDPLVGVVKNCSYLVTGVASTPPANAVDCAGEGGTCTLPSGAVATVYYGAGGKFAIRTGVAGSIACSYLIFGDPIYGTVKRCSYVVTGGAGAPAANAVDCAAENAICTLPAGTVATVYYGAGIKFSIKTGVAGSVGCNNATFGDPIYGTVKRCSYVVYADAGTAPAASVDCAAENAICTLPTGALATVYYGASGKFATKVGVAGSIGCNNATFGDPIYGTVKRCSYKLLTVGSTVNALPVGAASCAVENGSCTLPPGMTAAVYYGAGSGTAATRPAIGYAPDSIGYGGSFVVTPNQAAGIARVHLIKLGSVTHSNNQGQRLVPLTFTVSGASLQVKAPASPSIAPPGHYMLFVVDAKGVPSVAKILQLQQYSVVALISRSTGKAIEVMPGTDGSGTDVQMMGDAAAPGLHKSWDLVPTDSGFFKLVSRSTGAVLSVPAASMQVGTRVQALPDASGAHQQWRFSRSALGYFTVRARHDDYVLEVASADTADGAAVVQQALAAAPQTHDEWEILPVGYQRVVGVQSGKVTEVAGRSTADGAGVDIAPNGGDTHQSFRFVRRDDGHVSVEAAHSGKVLGVSGASMSSTAPLAQQTWNGAAAQQWALLPQKDGSFLLQVRHSGQYMNVLYDKVDSGSPIGQYPDNGGLPNQYWRLIPAVSLDPHQRNAGGRAIASAHVSGVGWLPWVAASNTIGQPDSGNLEALKVSAKGVRSGLQISYRAQSPDGSWQAWVGDNQMAGTTGQSTPIQGFQATLGGSRNDCSIRYRGHVKGAGWQDWKSEGATAGASDVATPLLGLQLIVECASATMAYAPN